ncbi:MAG: RNA polymerase sigma factor [Pseudomonadota bacterium]
MGAATDQDGAAERDITLVAAARAGDASAFARLVERHHARLIGLMTRLSGDRSQAEDLAQQAFVDAWQRLVQLRGDERFGAWLARIAYRLFLARKRRGQVERRYLEAERVSVELGDVEPSQGDTPTLDALLAPCTAEQRELLYMAYALELSQAEIAKVTGQPLGTVKSHIRRGQRAIAQAMASEGDATATPIAAPIDTAATR